MPLDYIFLTNKILTDMNSSEQFFDQRAYEASLNPTNLEQYAEKIEVSKDKFRTREFNRVQEREHHNQRQAQPINTTFKSVCVDPVVLPISLYNCLPLEEKATQLGLFN